MENTNNNNHKKYFTTEACLQNKHIDQYDNTLYFIHLAYKNENICENFFVNQKKLYYHIYEIIQNKDISKFDMNQEIKEYIWKKYYKEIQILRKQKQNTSTYTPSSPASAIPN